MAAFRINIGKQVALSWSTHVLVKHISSIGVNIRDNLILSGKMTPSLTEQDEGSLSCGYWNPVMDSKSHQVPRHSTDTPDTSKPKNFRDNGSISPMPVEPAQWLQPFFFSFRCCCWLDDMRNNTNSRARVGRLFKAWQAGLVGIKYRPFFYFDLNERQNTTSLFWFHSLLTLPTSISQN